MSGSDPTFLTTFHFPAPPLWKLEDECAKRLRTLRAAFTVLLASPFGGKGWEEFEQDYYLREETQRAGGRTAKDQAHIMRVEACGKAGVALASDILLSARTQRWYRPINGEQPTTAELKRRDA